MDTLMNILRDINDSIDYEQEEGLIDKGLFNSFAILLLVSELEENFCVEIKASELIPENFNSMQQIRSMIKKLQES